MKIHDHTRKPTRLPGWDYTTPGYYFVTICVHQMACLLGDVVDERVILSPLGKLAHQTWMEVPDHYPDIGVEPFVVMPNHLHAIIEIRRGGFYESEAIVNPPDAQAVSLTEIIRGYKTWSARRINSVRNAIGTPVWQRSFYDRVIRNEEELHAIEKYILANPQNWENG